MKYLLEGRLHSSNGHYYHVGLIVDANSFSDAEDKGNIFSMTGQLYGMGKFLVEAIKDDTSVAPSKMTVLIYMNDPQQLKWTDANQGGFPKFIGESLAAAKDAK